MHRLTWALSAAVCPSRSVPLPDASPESPRMGFSAVSLRAGAQALVFHALRWLGLAEGLRSLLVQRRPPAPADALLCVALALLARRNPPNLTHFVLDNASHDTVGGIPTASEHVILPALARSFGYPHAAQTDSAEGIRAFCEARSRHPGIAMLAISVRPGHRADLPRPKETPAAAKTAFLAAFPSRP